jgi:hypothetical protein
VNAQCRSCGAPVEWAVTQAGKRMPIDPEPRADGNIQFTGRILPSERGSVREVRYVTAQAGFFDDGLLARYVSHFATCPDADMHRKPPAKVPAVNRAASAAARNEGIARADRGALEEWKAEADRIIDEVARSQAEVTSDDVWRAGLGPNPTGSNTALGARFKAAAAAGLLVKTDRVRMTELASSHRSPMTVWASQVVGS